MAPKLKLYYMFQSPPCRVVMMVLDMLNLKYEAVVVDIQKGEGKTPEYLELNPQHNIPLLLDGNLRLNESRAICCYLISKYAKGDMKKLYPEDDVLIKAKIDQKLYFDMGTFYQVAFDDFASVMFKGAKNPSQELLEKYQEVLKWVTAMVKSGYVAGTPYLTLADILFVSTFASIKAFRSIDTRPPI